MHKTKLVLLTAAALLAITSGAEAAKVKRSSGFSIGRPASVSSSETRPRHESGSGPSRRLQRRPPRRRLPPPLRPSRPRRPPIRRPPSRLRPPRTPLPPSPSSRAAASCPT
ncbi:MAG: hypothetical protein ACLUNV_08645 [Sutterella wadsworthensis]